MANDKPESLLVLSDLHRGALISNLPDYEKSLFKKMRDFDHVVLNGDVFELFYIKPDFYKRFRADGSEAPPMPKYVVKHAIRKSIDLLDEFLKDNPKCHLHFVLGNHENILKFRHQLDTLQKKHKNFEWDPDAIRIGDALFTHGDLQMDKDGRRADQQDEYIPRVRDALNTDKWRRILDMVHEPGYWIDKIVSRPEKAARKVHDWIQHNDGKFSYKQEGKRHVFHMKEDERELPWLKHVFFGHTHIKFIDQQIEGIHYHNTGALVRSTSGNTIPHGMLEAELKDGFVEKIHAFEMQNKDAERA